MPSISGQSILIIGGSSGIGFSVAKLALGEKARVAIASSSEIKVNDALNRLKTAFPEGDVTGSTVDLDAEGLEPQLEELLKKVTARGPLDHLILTAGRSNLKPIAQVDEAYLAQVSRARVVAPILLAKLAPEYLRQGYGSSVIYTTGQVADKPLSGYSVFCNIAAGIHGLARGLALDLAPLRFNVVSPGPTETEMWGERREVIRQSVSSRALLGKPGAPDEVAEAYIYLMRNTDATGSIVNSNGGSVLL